MSVNRNENPKLYCGCATVLHDISSCWIKKKWSKNEVNLNLFTDNNDNGAEKECESMNLKMIEI